MQFNSDAKQDEFVANLLKFKKNGYYLDIGSCYPDRHNNTYVFESLDWDGICIEYESKHNETYNIRKCKYINADANQINYLDLFNQYNVPKNIDYLSLDVDTISYSVLLRLPFENYTFSVITIEHDAYLYGDTYRGNQRSYLISKGYELICADVFVQQPGFDRENSPFEDWWIHPNFIDRETINKIYTNGNYPTEILKKFN